MPSDNWQVINSQQYLTSYQQFGGSVATHPEVVATMSAMIGTETIYKACYRNEKLVAAIPVWDEFIAGDRRYLKKFDKQEEYDFSNTEIILPIAPQTKLNLNSHCNNLSILSSVSIEDLQPELHELCFAKNMHMGEFSKRFLSNHRRKFRLFQDQGGSAKLVSEFSVEQLSSIYLDLFRKRWGKLVRGHQRLVEFLTPLENLLFGYVLFKNNKAIAIQLILLANTNCCISAVYINGGVDPEYSSYSAGSILTFLNIRAASQCAENANKQLRYSFGLPEQKYKDTWCVRQPVYQC